MPTVGARLTFKVNNHWFGHDPRRLRPSACARAGATRRGCGSRVGKGKEGRGAHLGRVAEEAESEAAAFELHLQGGAPGHRDPAPVVSGEHAGGLARLPVLCTPGATRLCHVSSTSVSRRPPAGRARELCCFPNSAPGDDTWAEQGAAPSFSTPVKGRFGWTGPGTPSQP